MKVTCRNDTFGSVDLVLSHLFQTSKNVFVLKELAILLEISYIGTP